MSLSAAARWCQRTVLLAVATLVLGFAGSIGTADQARADSVEEWLAKSFPSKVARPSKLGGPARAEGATRRKRGPKGVQVASLGDAWAPPKPSRPSLSGGVNWVASSSCLNSTLRGVIHDVASSYGRVTVSSTCRSHGHNRRVGGARRSHHLTGDAADFRVHGNWRAAYAYLRSNGSLGGVKHYGGGLFHIDTGPRRSW